MPSSLVRHDWSYLYPSQIELVLDPGRNTPVFSTPVYRARSLHSTLRPHANDHHHPPCPFVCSSVRKAGLKAIFVFLAPPSLEALAERLAGRGTETPENVQRRLANAKIEVQRSVTAT